MRTMKTFSGYTLYSPFTLESERNHDSMSKKPLWNCSKIIAGNNGITN